MNQRAANPDGEAFGDRHSDISLQCGTFAFESFSDEIVVLNLDDGIYYAFGGAAFIAFGSKAEMQAAR
jgi:hypothetical protein